MEKIQAIKNELPHLKAVVQTHPPYLSSVKKADGYWRWSELEAMETDNVESEYQFRLSQIAVNECCCLIYTSGTVGPPKGVMLSHDNLIFQALVDSNHVEFTQGEERAVSYLPLSHIAAQAGEIFLPLILGATVYFADKDALKGSLMKTLQSAQPTFLCGVPRVYEKMQERMMAIAAQSGTLKKAIGCWAKSVTLAYHTNRMAGVESGSFQYKLADKLVISKVRQALGFQSLRFLASGGAPMNVETKKYFLSLGIIILDIYGLSETTCGLAMCKPDYPYFETVGQTMSGMKTKIINPDEKGQGEICAQGRNVFMGYLNEMDKTVEAIDDDRWYHTGDIGFIDNDGFIFITGRIKELIITAGGENIAAPLIEETIKSECIAISNAIVIGDKRKFLVLLVTLKTELDYDGVPLYDLATDTLKWLEKMQLNYKKLSEVLAYGPDVKILQAVQEAVDRANANAISNAQKIQKFAILPQDFSIALGELTPTMKTKRNVISEKYRDLITKLYE